MALISGLLPPASFGQAAAPPGVVGSAIKAVEALGKKVVMGDHKAAVDLMYPQWKERMAKREGGQAKLEAKLASIGPMMARNGVQILSFKTLGQPSVYEVVPEGISDDGVEKTGFRKWLLLIPTVTQFGIMDAESAKRHVINSHGFQVAIADKGQDNWTFINGSDVTSADLRRMFVTLPVNMDLPPIKREEAK